jgi:hypothetical protein
MRTGWLYVPLFGLLSACSGTDASPSGTTGDSANSAAGADALGEQVILPLGAADDVTAAGTEAANAAPASELPQQFVSFVEASSAFSTNEVFDADRERVRFDATRGAMVASANGDSVSGWTTAGNDLRWTGSSVAFRVRFGTESGERRAFFTETASGTICNLSIDGPGSLSIRGTSELPPNP